MMLLLLPTIHKNTRIKKLYIPEDLLCTNITKKKRSKKRLWKRQEELKIQTRLRNAANLLDEFMFVLCMCNGPGNETSKRKIQDYSHPRQISAVTVTININIFIHFYINRERLTEDKQRPLSFRMYRLIKSIVHKTESGTFWYKQHLHCLSLSAKTFFKTKAALKDA